MIPKAGWAINKTKQKFDKDIKDNKKETKILEKQNNLPQKKIKNIGYVNIQTQTGQSKYMKVPYAEIGASCQQ